MQCQFAKPINYSIIFNIHLLNVMGQRISAAELSEAMTLASTPLFTLVTMEKDAVVSKLQWLMEVIDDQPGAVEMPRVLEEHVSGLIRELQQSSADKNASPSDVLERKIAAIKNGEFPLISDLDQYERNQFLDRFPQKSKLIENMDNLDYFDGVCTGWSREASMSEGRRDAIAWYHYFSTKRKHPTIINVFMHKAKKPTKGLSTAAGLNNYNMFISLIDARKPFEKTEWALYDKMIPPEADLSEAQTEENLWPADERRNREGSQAYGFLPRRIEWYVRKRRGEDQPALQGGQLDAQFRLARLDGGQDFIEAFGSVQWKKELEKFATSGDLDVLLDISKSNIPRLGILEKVAK